MARKIGLTSKKVIESEAERVRRALDKGENPLSEEEMHFIQTCCQILKVDEKQKGYQLGRFTSSC
jgi:hypothetical protein